MRRAQHQAAEPPPLIPTSAADLDAVASLEEPPPLLNFSPGRRRITRTVCAAVSLFTLGSVMLFYGVQALPSDRDRGISMCVVGALSFLPGSYATWHLLGAWLGWPDFDYDMVPSYDD